MNEDELLVEFINLDQERAEIEKRLGEIKTRAAAISKVLLDDWANHDVQAVKFKNRTVYIRRDFYCSKKGGVDAQKVCDALRAHGYGAMVHPSYAPAALKALVREMVDDEREVPAELDALIQFDTIPRLMVRGS